MYQIALVITQYLHFDVLGRSDEFFQENRVIAKSLGRLSAGFGICGFKRFLAVNDTHTPAASAGDGF